MVVQVADYPVDLAEFVEWKRAQVWQQRASCARAGKRMAWFKIGEDQKVEFCGREVSGREAHRLAVEKFCIECDVQWECATHAIRTEEGAGVWGVVRRDVVWLQRLGWGEELVEAARDEGVPVHIAVRRARRALREDDPQCFIELAA